MDIKDKCSLCQDPEQEIENACADDNNNQEKCELNEQKCQNAVDEWKQKYIQLLADFENYKKRTTLQQVEWGMMSQKALILDLLVIIDDFERALAQPQEQASAWLEGVKIIHQSLTKLLKKYGV